MSFHVNNVFLKSRADQILVSAQFISLLIWYLWNYRCTSLPKAGTTRCRGQKPSKYRKAGRIAPYCDAIRQGASAGA
ncbi:uncharacterized protein Dvar_10700 [Desulfosarcina variabilis str. Montpellier]